MSQYLLIAEFSNKRIGFIIGTFGCELEAELLIRPIREELEIYSLNSMIDIPRGYFKKYASYEIKGDKYFTSCDKYNDRICSSNGDLSISVIRCTSKFDIKSFIDYRNFFKYYGEMMN